MFINSSLGSPFLIINSGRSLDVEMGIPGRVDGRDEPDDLLKRSLQSLKQLLSELNLISLRYRLIETLIINHPNKVYLIIIFLIMVPEGNRPQEYNN